MHEPDAEHRCPIDLEAALEYAGGDPGFLRKLFSVFLEESRGQVVAIRAALAEKRADQMTHAAHSVKGSLRLFGATEAAALAERLELAGHASRLEGLEPDVARFEQELARLLRWMEAQLAVPGPGATPIPGTAR
jgi:HPt (histidine-containing phosphotransfer) domain-containing protein